MLLVVQKPLNRLLKRNIISLNIDRHKCFKNKGFRGICGCTTRDAMLGYDRTSDQALLQSRIFDCAHLSI